jgi:hypothetical protein
MPPDLIFHQINPYASQGRYSPIGVFFRIVLVEILEVLFQKCWISIFQDGLSDLRHQSHEVVNVVHCYSARQLTFNGKGEKQ